MMGTWRFDCDHHENAKLCGHARRWRDHPYCSVAVARESHSKRWRRPGLVKADVVDSTQGRIFSHIVSCFAITLDGNVSNDYAGYRFSFTSQCWRVGTQQHIVGRAGSGHNCQSLAQRGGGVQTTQAYHDSSNTTSTGL